MAENQTMNLNIIHYLLGVNEKKCNFTKTGFHDGVFTIQIAPRYFFFVPFSYNLLLGKFQMP